MSGYTKPKKRLHREFLYLDHETILNSLSALEAGKVDEIIEKVSEAREGGVEGGLGYGPAKLSGGKKKTANIEEELRRTRTWFSAFEAWLSSLEEEEAIGSITSWDLETRDELQVGDTVRFTARVSLSPVQQVFLTYIAFANEVTNADSPFKQPAKNAAETKRIARMMANWMSGKSDTKDLMVYLAPYGAEEPVVAARLRETFIVGGTQAIEGDYTVVAQVESLIGPDGAVPAIRVIRDVPPTSMETKTITEALANFITPAQALGVDISDKDINLQHPGVIVHPIAIYR